VKSSRVIVVGSANQDYLVRTERVPLAGETTMASGLAKQPGGKGANQAVAAARLGADVYFVGAVGRDDDGARILRSLQNDGVSIDDVRIVDGQPTGLALIMVDGAGQNSITVVPGANGTVTIDRATSTVVRLAQPGAVLSMQGELPVPVLEAAARAGAEAGLRVMINLAPYAPIAADVLALADPLVVNESEAAELTGLSVADVTEGHAAAEWIADRARSAVVTLGAAGAVWRSGVESGHSPADAPDTVVDTTGAGDAFTGAVASALAAGRGLGDAVHLGTRAGSFAIRGLGAQSSYARDADLG
jgi:ribokinase